MTINLRTRQSSIETVAILHILLFVYAAVNKLLDFENFQVQLGQSPLLSSFAGVISIFVPFIELLLSVLLLFRKFRLYGLYGSLLLMVLFSTYIFIILNFSPFVPCSCGGILDKLGWIEHFIFNLAFVLLAITAILLYNTDQESLRKKIVTIGICIIAGVGSVIFLFLVSENMIHTRNPFIRRFPHHPVSFVNAKDLQLNSYYIAGIGNDNIYLGNVTAPLTITEYDANLKNNSQTLIKLSNLKLPFRSVTISVKPPYFYVKDGTVPCIFKGTINDWKASLLNYKTAYFSVAEPTKEDKIAIRTTDSKTNQSILGLITAGDSASVKLVPGLLTKQIDGVFDSDGMLLHNSYLNKILYVHFYRNQFIITNTNLEEAAYGNTIDTISRAKITIAYVSSTKERKMSAPPLTVNKNAATYGNYLFVHSGLMGRFEPLEKWKKASVIDVYNLKKKTYEFSFYIPNKGDAKLSEFKIADGRLWCMIGDYLTLYRLNKDHFDNSVFENNVSGNLLPVN